jgi:phytoene desaturase
LSGADYHHTETLLDKEFRAYSEKYWDRVFAPSSLLFYVGFDKKLKTYHIMLCFLILSACKRYL